MGNSTFNNCEWLTFNGCDACLTRTEFTLRDIKSALLNITALGYFEAFINARQVSDDKLIPAMSDYEKRDLSEIHMPIFDNFTHRIYYHTFDITSLLQNGQNVLSTHIGAGWYGQHESPNEGMPYWGDNTLVFSLVVTHKDGSTTYINSGKDNVKWKKSYILEAGLYYGEYHDLRKYQNNWKCVGFNDSEWEIAKSRTAPDSELVKCDFPTDRTVRTIEPKVIFTFGDIKIYDIGEEAAGFAVIKFDGNAVTNERATLRYADELNADGSLNFHYVGGTHRMQRDHFVFCSDAHIKEHHPHFTWHTGRYIEITGKASIVRFEVVHSDIPQISDFSCDNETLQWIFDAYVRTQKSNIHGCIPSDCPHRERLGYTGDGQLTCGAVMSVFDATRLYKKWMQDIRDCQDKENGHVQHTAPFYGGGGGPGGWGGAAVIVPYRYYKFYNDKSVLEESFDSMKLYIKYMINHTEDGLVTHEEKGGWCLGDWCPPNNNVTIPEAFVNTYFLTKCCDMLAEACEILDKNEDKEYYTKLGKDAKSAIIKHYFNAETESFCNGEQGADAFAVDLGIGTEKTKENLAKKYSELLTFDTGIFGTDILIRVLFSMGLGELAFKLITNEKEDSFYNMKKHGATTLWENWNGCDSRCHPMFGAIVEYFFSYILGIKRYNDNAGYSKIKFSPADIPALKNVKGTMQTKWGKISVSITTDKNGKKTASIITDSGIEVLD